MTSPEPLVLPIQTAPPEEPIPAAPYPNVRSTLNMLINRGVYQRCDRVYTKLVDIVYRVSCIHVHTRNFINTRKYIHEIFSLNYFLKIFFIGVDILYTSIKKQKNAQTRDYTCWTIQV